MPFSGSNALKCFRHASCSVCRSEAVDRLMKESWDRWMKDSDNVPFLD